MNSKKIENTNHKFIDELPRSRSKVPRRPRENGENSPQKGVRLSLVQIMAPILIAVVGIVVIYLIPDKLPSVSQPDDAQVNTTQAPQPKAKAAVRLTPSVAARDENSPSSEPEVSHGLEPSKKTPLGKGSIVFAEKDNTKTENKPKKQAVVEAMPRGVAGKQISLVSAVVCGGVQDRQPMVEKHAFSTASAQRVYVWMEVRSKSQPFVINHLYYRNGQKHSEVPLEIKYPRMRTWSYLTIDRPDHIGDWRVDIVHKDSILNSVEFQVSAGAE